MFGSGVIGLGSGLRVLVVSYVVPGPSGVAVRDRIKGLTAEDETVLRAGWKGRL